MANVKKAGDGCGPEAVMAATGRSIDHWRSVLATFDVAKNGHKAAASHLETEHGVDPWWSQQLTVQYEQETGLRLPGQRSDGSFAVNVSRTMAVGPEAAFEAWTSSDAWNAWFTTEAQIDFREGGSYANADKDRGVYRRIRPVGPPNGQGEVARIDFTWENPEHCPGSSVSVQFLVKGEGKTQVAVTHHKLPDSRGCEDMKEGWTWALTSLKSWLESGKPVRFEDWKAETSEGV
ncbi:MAG: SRPBCC domain-containing protein [Armatimonadetes bacterium]|nr:SRPBCC domain-containing protein [Armatimonadota bacterium]